jgi:hypothetical protein
MAKPHRRAERAAEIHARVSALVAECFSAKGDISLCVVFLSRAHEAAPEDVTILRRLGDSATPKHLSGALVMR